MSDNCFSLIRGDRRVFVLVKPRVMSIGYSVAVLIGAGLVGTCRLY